MKLKRDLIRFESISSGYESDDSNKEREAEIILGAKKNSEGVIEFLVKWKGIDNANWFTSNFVRANFPELLCDFYESRLVWDFDETNESDKA